MCEAKELEPYPRSIQVKVVLSFKKGNDVIKYALKGSGGWMGLGVGKLEAERLIIQQL